MTNTNVSVELDPHKYPNLPEGVQRWFGHAKYTSALGGNYDFRVLFNPDSDVTWQPWVSVSRMTLKSDTAAQTILGGGILRVGGSWEDPGAIGHWVQNFTMVNFVDAASFIGTMSEPLYLGRIARGTPGTLSVIGQEIDMATYVFDISGFISNFPIPANNNWRA